MRVEPGLLGTQFGIRAISGSSFDGSPDRKFGWRKDEHHDESLKEVPGTHRAPLEASNWVARER